MSKANLMLDTCALIWLVGGSGEISQETLRKITEAEIVYVSAISAWEISLKTARGKLELPKDPKEWFEKAIEHHNLFRKVFQLEKPCEHILCRLGTAV